MIQAEEILRMKRELNQLLADLSGQPLERLERDTERDFFMSAEEAQNYGLIDAVMSRRPEGGD
jgi:ATP-dependent Clp protease protease subunit